METKVYRVEEIKNLFLQEFLNKVDGKVSKVSDHSVLNGTAFGVSKVFQRAMKDVALLESEMFPEYAYGKYLDVIARRSGVVARRKNLGSSVYLKLVGTPGSLYIASQCVFTSTEGPTFKLVEDFEIGESGYGYVEARSEAVGTATNVGANTINRATKVPSGHLYVNNDMPASGGVDVESDESLMNRIVNNFNNFSFETLDKLTFVMQEADQRVLQIKKTGFDEQGRLILSIVTSNGVLLRQEELDFLLRKSLPYMSISDLNITNSLEGEKPSIVLKNIDYTYIDLDFRADLFSEISKDDFRRNIQEQISAFLDFRTWNGEKVEWEDLFYLVRGQFGIRSLPEQYFMPHEDIAIGSDSLPRLRGFVMRDMQGLVIVDNNKSIVPVYYGPDYSENVFFQINNTI